jgi:hypothetical protein
MDTPTLIQITVSTPDGPRELVLPGGYELEDYRELEDSKLTEDNGVRLGATVFWRATGPDGWRGELRRTAAWAACDACSHAWDPG